MNPWLESLAALFIAVTAFLLGGWVSRLRKPWWLVGYAVPLMVILVYCLASFFPALALAPPVSWLSAGRTRFVCFNALAVLLLSTPLARLPRKRTRVALCLFIFVLTAISVVPFIAPVFNRSYLTTLKTRIDGDGVCRQSNDYTCAPAAAVTALRKLGIPAEEGQIAILAHSSSLTGTEPDVLASVLQKHYGDQGLITQYRAFKDLQELKLSGLTIAVMKFNALQDHCVTVFGVDANHVLVGDPLNGFSRIPRDEFESKWLYVGIVLKRQAPASTKQ